MSAGQPLSYLNLLKAFIAGWFIVLVASCTVVKKYQPNKPFVYKTNINLIGDFRSEEKQSLISGLKGQLDDSMRARKLDKLLWSVIKNPPVYDSANADKSVVFMRALLISLGYFNDSISYHDTVINKPKDQLRTTITFDVKPGKLWRLDSISYNINSPELQKLADSFKKDAYIKKGDAFAKAPISAEIDRLTDLYRDNGYFRFNRDALIVFWDTAAFNQLVLDPIELMLQSQQAYERRKNPTADLEFKLRNIDSSKLTRFYNGNVTVYPNFTIDTLNSKRIEETVDGIKIIQFQKKKFKSKIFSPNIYLPRDSVYRQQKFFTSTINRLNSLGAWRLVNIDPIQRNGQDTIDFVIRLTPAKKYSFNTTLEGSINQTAILGRFFGIGVNVGVQNRNNGKSANLTNTNIRYGVELGGDHKDQFIQTQQIGLSYSIFFPRAILINRFIKKRSIKENLRTFISANASITERRLLFNLTSLNGAWGYEYLKYQNARRRGLLLTIKLPNIEYSLLNKKDSLDNLIANNPSLKNIFTDGFIFSTIANLTLNKSRSKNYARKEGQKEIQNVFHANFEGTPLILGFFHNQFLDTQLYRFLKIDADFARVIRNKKTSVIFRFFGGLGIADPFHTTVNPDKRNTLPFFKQYFSGGPNSMRAWALRRLGPGSIIDNFNGKDGTPDRYGDVQLEANAEYRFPIGRPFGIKINGAVFTDVGNIWLLKKAAGPPEAVFSFSHLGKDIAVGAGAGLRVDFSFFVIRLDYSYKIKDPSPSLDNAALQNKWFGYPFFKGTQFQLGIGYPFIF